MIVVENILKGKTPQWYTMMKYASPNFEKFKDLFLKQYFLKSHQLETFFQCREAGKNWYTNWFLGTFPSLDDATEIVRHAKNGRRTGNQLDLETLSYINSGIRTKLFREKIIPIWEKLGEIENRGKTENKPETEGKRIDYRNDYRSDI